MVMQVSWRSRYIACRSSGTAGNIIIDSGGNISTTGSNAVGSANKDGGAGGNVELDTHTSGTITLQMQQLQRLVEQKQVQVVMVIQELLTSKIHLSSPVEAQVLQIL